MKYFIFFLILITNFAHASDVKTFESIDRFKMELKLSSKRKLVVDLDLENQKVNHFYLDSKVKKWLSKKDKRMIAELLKNKHGLSLKVASLIESLPVGAPLTPKFSKVLRRKGYTSICHLKGFINEGSYIFVGKRYKSLDTVGAPQSNCMGLCGRNCKKGIGKDIYTQECFDHDLCHRQTKSFFGCFGELVRAIPGFFFGDSCS